MTLGTWYSFEDDDHTYGYTLFYPLKLIRNGYYGIYIHCNDGGPNGGSRPSSWIESGFGHLDEKLNDASIEYWDNRGKQPPLPREIILHTFFEDCSFLQILRDRSDAYIN